ncbi:MAG: glycosyltransferase [Desulfovibrio desulfuricans]|nr:glycosyltransferase [Desulfovibrio desulfuricans]
MRKEYADLLDPYFRNVPFPEITGEKPLISILTAYYNHAPFLRDYLDSVIGQAYENWELLLVDNASTQGDAAAIVREYDDPRITYRRLENNSGGAIARTAAFRMSHGEFIACFDADDIMHPWYLQAMTAEMLSPSSPDIVNSYLRCFGSDTSLWKRSVRTERDLTLEHWIGGTSLAKRYLWEATGGQSSASELRYGSQDWEFWLHCYEKCGPLKVAVVPLPLFLYRRNVSSLSLGSIPHEYAIRKRILTDHPAIFAKHGTGEHFLAKGYGISIGALFKQKQLLQALKVFCEGLRTLPSRLYLSVVFYTVLADLRDLYGERIKPFFRHA